MKYSGSLILAVIILNILFQYEAVAQHSAPIIRDTIPLQELQSENNSFQKMRSPGRAAMLSAALPGLGQAYNGVYWKIPIIYAGFGGVALAIDFNHSRHQKWRKAFIAKVDDNPNTIDDYPAYSDAALRRAMEFYRRNLELTYIVGVALYLLNILDANVQAHLMDFDVGPNLGMQIHPSFEPMSVFTGMAAHSAGLKITFRF